MSVPNGNLTHGLWDATAPPAPKTTFLDGDISVDVAIVGAGYTGLSAALHLAERGVRVAILEAATVGHGAAGRNSGLVNAGMWVPPDDFSLVFGPEYGERLVQVLGEAPQAVFNLIEKHDIQCELERSGTLLCAVAENGLRAIQLRADQWGRRSAAVELLDANETERKVGSSFYRGALLDKRAGSIQPLAYARGLATAAIAAGADVYTDSPAEEVQQTTAGWRLHTRNGHADAHWIIVATDIYSRGTWWGVQSELTHLPYFNIATRPLAESIRNSILPERQGITDTRTVLSSIRFDRSGRLIIGSIGELGGNGSHVHIPWAKRAVQKLFPQIGDVDFEYGWCGSIGMTDTHLPKFHRLAPQVLSISGYNGRGVAAGTVFGRLLSQLIMGDISEREMPLPLTAVRIKKFRSLQSLYYEIGARAAHFIDARR